MRPLRAELTGPGDDEEPSGPFGINFLYHPGDFLMKDDSGLLCQSCWTAARAWLGEERPENRCARCGEAVEHARSVHLHRTGDPTPWQLCPRHAVDFLNRLRTVEPKLAVETLTLAADWRRPAALPGGAGVSPDLSAAGAGCSRRAER